MQDLWMELFRFLFFFVFFFCLVYFICAQGEKEVECMIGSEERRTLTADTADIVRFLVGDPGMEGLKSWTGRCLGVVYTSGRCKMEIEVVAGNEYNGLGRCCVIVKFFSKQ